MHEPNHLAVARVIADRFTGRWHRGYVRSKLRFDPAYAAVVALLLDSEKAVFDIGCGLGLLGMYLSGFGYRGAYLGLDFDAAKIAEARRVTDGIDFNPVFAEGDATTLPAFSGHVVMLDMLHYLPAAEQQNLLNEAAARVGPGAMLIMRNVLRERNWRFYATCVEEYFLHVSRWMRSPARHYPDRLEIERTLTGAGLDVEIGPLWGHTPFNSFLIVARRHAHERTPVGASKREAIVDRVA